MYFNLKHFTIYLFDKTTNIINHLRLTHPQQAIHPSILSACSTVFFSMSVYVLEVQQFINDKPLGHDRPAEENGVFIHVGYTVRTFESKLAAAEGYDCKFPTMRKLNAHGRWVSDWNPTDNNYRYVVRRYFGERRTMPL